VDRVVDLEGIPIEEIKREGFDYLLEDGYLAPEAILIRSDEVGKFSKASRDVYRMFSDTLNRIVKNQTWRGFKIPRKMQELISYSWEQKHKHIIGRFDFGGGIDDSPLKLIEFNADTATMIPESSVIQKEFLPFYSRKDVKQFNYLVEELTNAFKSLKNTTKADFYPSMLFTTLGYPEDRANVEVLMDAAESVGFDVAYSDLEYIHFDEEQGVLIENSEGEFEKYDFLYKLVPWEFICFEEPDLLSILHEMILGKKVYVINPAYVVAFQSKAFMAMVFESFPNEEILLKTYFEKWRLKGKPYVEKVTFGRLGENIIIYDSKGEIHESTNGDFGHFPKIYQEYTKLYEDDDGETYQGGLYFVDGVPACLSFRRADKLIIDDDAEFIPHFVI